MSGIRATNTKPEIQIRSALHLAGYRFRLHRKDLPGRPDIVLPASRVVVFVNGCFWHCHKCSLFKWPSTRPEFWRKKIESNRIRDALAVEALQKEDWRVAILWECATKGRRRRQIDEVINRLTNWIEFSNRKKFEIQEKKR